MSFPVVVGLEIGMEKLSYASNQNGRVLGTKGITPDGRVFRWALNGGTALAAGKLVQTAAEVSGSIHVNGLTVINTTATGVTTITVTMATTPLVANMYADGDMIIDTSPGQAMYRVKSNAAAVSAADAEFVLYESDKIRDALTSGTSLVGFRRNPYTSVIVSPTTITGAPIGVTPISVGVSRYFWLQTWGLAIVHLDQAPVAGKRVITGILSAGNLDISSTSSADTTGSNEASSYPQIGIAQTVGAGADKYHRIFLTISP
jgi:hypothetical protein